VWTGHYNSGGSVQFFISLCSLLVTVCAAEDHPDVQGRLVCTRLVIAPQPLSAKNGTLQSVVDIPDERDRCHGPPPPRRSDDDDDNDDNNDD